MRGAAHLWLVMASLLMASPLAAQSVGQLPGEDRTSGSVPPAPPPERRYTPPPFPKFSPTPPKARHIRVTPKPKKVVNTTKSKRVVAGKRATARKATTPVKQLSSRERKDQRWCASLSKKQLGRNSKCRKVLDKRDAAQPISKGKSLLVTSIDRKDERRCGKLSLNQVLRDSRCRKVAERHLAAKPVRDISKGSTHRAKAKSKVRPTKKRSRR